MDQFKFSLGPYELFSSIISGIPLLAAIYLRFLGDLSVESEPLSWMGDVSFTTVVIVAVLSYFTGAIMSGFSFKYFKLLSRIVKRDYRKTERTLLQELNTHEASSSSCNDEHFESRLAYLVRKQLGDTPYRWVCPRLMPYLRKHAPHLGAHADQLMAQKTMLRNISFGFFVLAITLLIKVLVFDYTYVQIYIVSLICFYVAFFSFKRALTFRGWWARDILYSFYHVAYEQEAGLSDA